MNELQENLKTHMESSTWYLHYLVDRAVHAVFQGDGAVHERRDHLLRPVLLVGWHGWSLLALKIAD